MDEKNQLGNKIIFKIFDKLLWLLGVGAIAIISTMIAKGRAISSNEYRITNLEKTSAKKSDIELILSGLCIINEETCKLKKDIKQ